MKQIRITISKDGKVTIETSGFSGAACQKATEGLERKLGKVASDTPTEEFYASNANVENQY